MSQISEHRETLGKTFRSYQRVLLALIMRDVSTRFMGNSWGFLIAVAWPIANIFIVLAINTAMGRPAPFGDSTALWLATGLVPFMAFQYMSRFIVMGLFQNRAMLGYPIVHPMDIMLARAIVEVLNAGLTVVISILVLTWMGVHWMPRDPVQALCAMGASILLGFGFGLVNGVIGAIWLPWGIGFGFFGILAWIASGVVVPPDSLPEVAQYWLSFNPSMQTVIWMRSAYFEGYGASMLDKQYTLSFSLISLFLGLLFERLMRARILA